MDFHPEIGIDVFDNVYPPSEDSELLIKSLEVKKGERILEIGCGSGVVSLHCAFYGCRVTSVDINPRAVECTRHNAERNGLVLNVFLSDLYENVEGKFDTIVFNLPYLPVDDEGMLAKAWSGGEDGLGPLPELLEKSDRYLNPDGRVVVVTSSLMDQVKLERLLSMYKVRRTGELPLFFEKLSVLEITP